MTATWSLCGVKRVNTENEREKMYALDCWLGSVGWLAESTWSRIASPMAALEVQEVAKSVPRRIAVINT